jgi:hypothetical protein
VLVHLRLLAGIDLFLIRLKQSLGDSDLNALAGLSGLLISSEFSIVYAAIGAMLLSRAGVSHWALVTTNARCSENLGQEITTHVAAMRIRQPDDGRAPNHRLVASAEEWPIEPELPQSLNQATAGDRAEGRH